MLMMWLFLRLSQPQADRPPPRGVAYRLGVLLGVAAAALAAFYAAGGKWQWTFPPVWSQMSAHRPGVQAAPSLAAAHAESGQDAAAVVPPLAPPAAAEPPLVAEDVFGRQAGLMQRALAGLLPRAGRGPSLYFVAFAADGGQDVFLKEALYSRQLFEERFGARHRSLVLANNRAAVKDLPLATATNLRQALAAIGRLMDPERDLLFLFLDSHGAPDGSLAVQLDGLSFEPLTAAGLAGMLRDAGIRRKVILVSGCYSGSFLPALQDGRTLVMTAAGADRPSSGCGDSAGFTDFARAYFAQALRQTRSFTLAFDQARTQVAQWEARDHRTPSEPQIAGGPAIDAQIARWRRTLPAD
ncbi:MAG: peptidase C13 [Nevskia sp.]|nr:peptidase C13 [Nevskia sp.]